MTPLVRELLAAVIGLCHSNAAMTSLSAHFRGKPQVTCKAAYVVELDRRLTRLQKARDGRD